MINCPLTIHIIITLLVTPSLVLSRNHYHRHIRHSYVQPQALIMQTTHSSPIKLGQINFVPPNSGLTQGRWSDEAAITFQAKGMDHLYLLTQYVINWLQQPGLPNGVIREDMLDYPIETLQTNQFRLFTHFWGTIFASTLALCLAIIVPMVGFLLCCCCCNQKSSNRAKRRTERDPSLYITSSSSPTHHHRRKNRSKYGLESSCDPFIRSFFTVVMFTLLLFISFFVICAFVTNEYVHAGINQMPDKFNQSLDDFQLYLRNTQMEVNTLLRTNFQQLEDQMSLSLNKSGLIVKNRLAERSKAIALDNLTEIVSKLDEIYMDLKHLANQTSILDKEVDLLKMGLDNNRKKLSDVFKYCNHPVCQRLEKRYGSKLNDFQVFSVSELPNLHPLIQDLSALIESGLIHELRKGKSAFDRISYEIQAAVNGTIPEIKYQVADVGKDLSSTADDINRLLDLPKKDILKLKAESSRASLFVAKYDVYRRYGSLAGASLVSITLISYIIGLMCGVFKKQPTYHEVKNRRAKPPSSCPFKLGIFFFFLSFGFLLIAAIGLFLTGVLTDRVGCFYLENPNAPQTRQIYEILMKKYDGIDTANYATDLRGVKPVFTDVLNRCHKNASLYRALQLNKIESVQLSSGRKVEGLNVTNILEFRGRNRIEARLKRFLSKVDFDPSAIVILNKRAYYLLQKLKENSLVTLDFSSFFKLNHQEVTPLDLHSISADLAQEAKALPSSHRNYSSALLEVSLLLDGYNKYSLKEIHETMNKLQKAAQRIKAKAQHGNKKIKEALNDLIDFNYIFDDILLFFEQAKSAQTFIEKNGRNAIKEVAESFVRDLNSLIDQYGAHITDEVQNRMGQCGPVSVAYNVSTLAVCKEVVLPYNGYWFSLISALFLLLPATICASILSRSFQKLKIGRGHRYMENDSDLTVDNSEEDDIPLAHVVKQTDFSGNFDSRRNPVYPSSSAPSAPAQLREIDWLQASSGNAFARPPPYHFVTSN